MIWRQSDLALDATQARRYLPWLVAMIVYLAGLSLAGMMSLTSTVERWDKGLKGTVTVQIPATASKAEVAKVLAIIKKAPGVTAARPLEATEIAKLLEPWLGKDTLIPGLPLPRLIDVKVKTEGGAALADLATDLAIAVPGTVLDDHQESLNRLITFASSVKIVAMLIVFLVALASLMMVIFVTRTGLAIHQDGIELLHLMGAMDHYVARQFLGQALKLGLMGGLIGLFLTAATVAGLSHIAGAVGGGLLPRLQLSMEQWLALGAVPLGVTAIAMVTAHFTVLHALKRMP
jgi:cell division transport system permease protein